MRSDAFITVTCDRCKKSGINTSIEVQLRATARGGYDERDVDSELEDMGWSTDLDEDVCPGCVEELEDELADDI